MRAAYLTLGCKVNQYDTEAMQEILQNNGFVTVPFEEPADVYLINTCTVTNIADRKSRQMIHKAIKSNPNSIVIVCGCLSQRNAEEVLAIDGVSAVIGTKNRGNIYNIVMRALSGEKIDAVSNYGNEREFEELEISYSGDRTRGYIKICEGCDNFCSYCIIPYARGRVRSRKISDIIEEAARLSSNGIKEVVLTGIHIGSYGKDLEQDISLIDVMEAVGKVDGIERIRLGSLEPSLLTEDFCFRASGLSKLCNHFHLSLQSGSTTVLKRMNRKYSAEEFITYVDTLRRYFKNPALTTDIIAGFAGETEQEHLQTMELIKRVGFSKVHVFPYSERKGTVAANMPGKLPLSLRKKRGMEISLLADELSKKYVQDFIGRDVYVLFEQESKEKPGLYEGLTSEHVTVIADGAANEIKKVHIIQAKNSVLYGRCVD